jgi:hypothetical protein
MTVMDAVVYMTAFNAIQAYKILMIEIYLINVNVKQVSFKMELDVKVYI